MSRISKKENKKGKHSKEEFEVLKKEKNKKKKVKEDKTSQKKSKQEGNEEIKKNKKSKIKEEQPKKKKSFLRRIISKICWILFLLILASITIFCLKTKANGGGIKGALITLFSTSVEEVENLETINILLLGMSEDLNIKLTDTIILCSYNPKNQNASMISIPRDTFIGNNKQSAKGNDKINTLYSKNPEKLLKKVSQITGINVENYAVVNTDALIKIVDIVGGVKFEVPIDMDYDDPTQDLHIHLKKGMQVIDGNEAEQLLRFRHNNDGTSYPASYGDNDYGRMKTQRDFMMQTIKQTINLKNILKVQNIYDTVLENIETNMDIEELFKYIPTTVNFNFESIVNKQLPGQSEKCNELWFFIHNSSETKNLIKGLELN